MSKIEINICHLYPDLLNLYGDRGNVSTMVQRLERRGIKTKVTELCLGMELKPDDFDIFFIGGGQDFEQSVLLKDLKDLKKDKAISEAIEADKTFLAICGGYQMLGNYYETWDGKQMPFIGAIDFYTVGAKERMVGDFMYQLDDEDIDVVGFENHSGRTYLGNNVKPLGRVLAGSGNNGEDKTEGVHYKNVFATYSHGPVLPKNPAFCDLILKETLKQKYPDKIIELSELDDEIENKAHKYMVKRLALGIKQSSNF